MKTTIELPDSLLESARKAAREDRTTLRALVEAGLREVLVRRERGSSFRLRDESVDGEGLDPAFRAAGWPSIRDAIHGPREE